MNKILRQQLQTCKGIWIFHALLLLLFPLLAFQSCIMEDMGPCVQYQVAVKVVGADGYELSSGTVDTVGIYLFNQDGFVRMLSTGNNNNYLFKYSSPVNLTFGSVKDEPLTLVAWGNLKSDSLIMPTLKSGQKLEDALVQLRKWKGYDLTTTDLFHTSCNTKESTKLLRSATAQKDTLTLSLNRAVASMSITAISLNERFGSDTTGYRFVVESSNNALNFLGNPSGVAALYAPDHSMAAVGKLVTPVFRVLPTPADDALTISLYRGSNLLYSTHANSNGTALKAIADKQLNVLLDFRNSNVKVSVTVTAWGEVTQDTEL